MQELFTLGKLYVSDFLKDGENPRGGEHELKLMMDDIGAVRLEKTASLDTMFGKYWYYSGINNTMRDALKDIVYSINKLTKLKENDLWIDIACFPAGNFINTINGNIDIKYIKLNDLVLSHDGKYHKVVKLFNREYDGNFIKLKLKGLNAETTMTENHPILTQRGWIEAKNLNKDDLISLRSGINQSIQYDINIFEILKRCHQFELKDLNNGFIVSTSNGLKHQLPKMLNLDENLVKILGYYIGEGDSCGGAGIRFSFSGKEMDKIEEIAKFFHGFDIKSEITIRHDGNAICLRINSRPLSSLFKYLCGNHAQNKKIPTEILNSNFLPDFVKSLWFTDGHLSLHKNRHGKMKKNYVFNSVSKNLILDLWNLLESMGIVCAVQHVKNNRGFSKLDGEIYRLTVERNKSITLLERLLSGEQIIPGTQERFVKINNIEYTKASNAVYNFEVEDSNSYICNGITVHNCNDGTLLSYVSPYLLRVGIDPAEDEFKKMAEKHSNLIIQDYFSAKGFRESKYGNLKAKVITSIAMFYDLEDPDAFIQNINEVLDNDGLWVMQLSYTPLMIEQLAFDNILSEHVYYYSLFNLKILLERNGFKLMDCQLNDINGGSFRVYIMKKNANENKFGTQPHRDVCRMRVNSLLEYEKTLHLSEKETWISFYAKIQELKEETVSFIKTAKAQGKKVYGYGASTKGNTLLQYFGLDSTLITAIAERSVLKWGLKTVGTNIPIISEDEMRSAKPDYLLCLPWHFINEFKEREKDLLQQGTQFIVPCPRFEIIGIND